MSQRLMLALLLGWGVVWSSGCGRESTTPEQAGTPPAAHAGAGSVPSTVASTPQRQVILNADLTVVVRELQQANPQVDTLIHKHAALVTRSSMDGYAGSSLSCQWTIRVSPLKYVALLKDLSDLGEVASRVESSQDVTAEAVDLDARIHNKTQEESRLLKHLESSTGNLQEILAVEKEVSRVREELERMQGQRNLLTDRVDWATITLRLTQQDEIVATKPVRFVDQVAKVWSSSWHALVTMLRWSCLFLLAIVPWLVTFGLPVVVIWRLVKRRRRVGTLST